MAPATRIPSSPGVCVIVPALNEARYIEACLRSLLAQDGASIVEVIVADGGSTDGTVGLVASLAREHPAVRLVHNAGRIQSVGVNLAARVADPRATILVRADAHMAYAPDFVRRCVTALVEHGATSVVVPMRTVGTSGFGRAVAFVQNSRLGNGGAAHRVGGGQSGFVDHGHHAAFDRAFFTACHGYDESFTHNEDAELDHRAHLAGGRIWMCAEAAIDYFPRRTPAALARQYLCNGRGRARTLLKHGLRPRMRQLAPQMLLATMLGSLALTPVWKPFALVPLLYLMLCSATGAMAAVRRGDRWLATAGFAAAIMHLSYATGFLQALSRSLMGQGRVMPRTGDEAPISTQGHGLVLAEREPG